MMKNLETTRSKVVIWHFARSGLSSQNLSIPAVVSDSRFLSINRLQPVETIRLVVVNMHDDVHIEAITRHALAH
jgi:hypothetical protein